MTDAQITINHDGTGSVTLGDHTTAIAATGAIEARQQAIALVADQAAELGRALPATATERGRSWPLMIGTDGTVAPRTQDEAAGTPTSAPAPLSEPSVAQGDLEATRPRTIAPESPSSPQPAFPAPQTHSPSAEQASPAELHTFHEVEADVRSSMDSAPHQEVQQDPSFDPEQPLPLSAAGPSSDQVGPDVLDADPRWAHLSQQPATQGLRGTLNGMGLKLAPAEEELAQRRASLREDIAREEQERLEAEERARTEAAQESRRAAREREAAAKDKTERTLIQTAFEEPKVVLIANDKGGQGKTTADYCIGATAGRIRGGDVVAWDANETRGNLGFRSQKAPVARSVVDLLEEAAEDFTTVQGSKRSTLARYTRNQGDNLFTVLASDESRDRQDLVDADAFAKVHEILGRFYSLILIDTGNNHRVSHFTAALAATDQLVIPVGAGADGAYAAETMMDSFEGLGYGDLVKNAVVLLNDSATRRGDATGIAARFQERVRAIIPIPFDPALDDGEEIDFNALQPATRAAYQEATAAICAGLADTPEREEA